MSWSLHVRLAWPRMYISLLKECPIFNDSRFYKHCTPTECVDLVQQNKPSAVFARSSYVKGE